MNRILVTGGAGFIGSNFIHYWLQTHPEDSIVNLDALTYAGNLENLSSIENHTHYTFIQGDITDSNAVREAMENIDVVVNFAAESHNDRGVENPEIFIKTNVLGTQVLLESAKHAKVKRFHHISTCEVFGDLALDSPDSFSESHAFLPRTPYNASKAGANHIAMAYYHTYGIPVTLSHCANNYGPYQFPEKIIPLFTLNALQDKPLPLFKSSNHKREWIHVEDHCRGIERILMNGRVGESYNIGTGTEKSIEEIADLILDTLHKPHSLKAYVPDRLGHDRRYLLDSNKIRQELNWKPLISFEEGIKSTLQWYIDHPQWWTRLLSHSLADLS